MGIFNANYMKEGPGVDKNAPKKKGVFLFFEIIFQKFTKLLGTGFLYAAVSIPYFVLAYVVLSTLVISGFGLDKIITDTVQSLYTEQDQISQATSVFYLSLRTLITVLLFNFMGSGPATASYAYIMKCYTKGEHAWILSDGWDKFKENFKQSIVIFVIDCLVLFLGMNAIAFYKSFTTQFVGSSAMVFTMIQYFTTVIMVLYMMMHIYIYQIMVTYNCKVTEILKYSAVMTLAKLPMSVLLTAISVFVIFILFYFMANPMVGIVIYLVLGIMLLRYPFDFYASRVIEKNIKAVKKTSSRTKITYLEENAE